MDALPIPDPIRRAPTVAKVVDFHLPPGSGISGPPAGAYLEAVQASNSIRPNPMWHLLLEVTDDDIEELRRSHVLVLAVSAVPIFMVYPSGVDKDGRLVNMCRSQTDGDCRWESCPQLDEDTRQDHCALWVDDPER